MAAYQILKILALIIIILPFSGAYYVLKRRKDLFPILPGAIFLVLSYLFTNLESVVISTEYNYYTHLFLMLSGILFLIGMCYMYYKKDSKNEIKINKKEIS